MPVVDQGRTVGAVRVTQSVDAVHNEVRDDVLALIGVARGRAAARARRGLAAGELARATAAATRGHRPHASPRGDLDARAPVEGSSEQREVASAFNDMTGRLARALRSQREFVANASHQLRTPLTGLRLRLEAAALKTSDPDVERELVAAERETVRLARLLSELLTLARERERPEPEEVSLAEVARAAHERWESPGRDAAGAGWSCAARASRVVAATEADLAVILDNLVENALNYSPVDTTVAIEWGPDGASARLAVLDEGRGVDPAERERVFERFYRGEASRDGALGHRPGAVGGGGARRALGRVDPAQRQGDRRDGGGGSAAAARTLAGGDPMSARNAALGAVLAVLGLAAAVGIGLAANAISDDSVGLSAQPLSAGDTLAPKTTAEKVKPRPRRRTERGEQTDTSSSTPAAPTSPAVPQDDHGGGGGSDDNPGSGSSGSGSSGSSGSGSSGSGSSGSNSGSSGSGSSGSSSSGGDDD